MLASRFHKHILFPFSLKASGLDNYQKEMAYLKQQPFVGFRELSVLTLCAKMLLTECTHIMNLIL